MNIWLCKRSLRSATFRIVVLLGLATHSWALHAYENSNEKLVNQQTGVYILEEWHKDGQVFEPPQVEGRFMFLNGVIMTVLHDRMQASSETTIVVTGYYTLDSSKFSYGYDNTSIYTESPSGVTASHQSLWEGLRVFAVSSEEGIVRMQSETGQQEFIFDANRLTYVENGKPLRVWRRATQR